LNDSQTIGVGQCPQPFGTSLKFLRVFHLEETFA
jgi:hypothetical protein